jgi:hypothetical protein
MEALMLKSFLEAHGIACVLIGLYASGVEPMLMQPVEVRVPRDSLEEANDLLKSGRRDLSHLGWVQPE